jgi:glutaconate CoA-transferase subunit A
MDEYAALVNGDPVEGMKEYLERYVYGPKSWTEYLALLGLEQVLTAARGGRSVSNA